MSFRLLIDECLSPELVELAIAAGHGRSTCVRDRGLLGAKDWELIAYAVANDFTLVTNNAVDFRGEGATAPGGLHAKQEIHAGVICMDSFHPLDIDRQCDLFRIALGELAALTDLVNQALEVYEDEAGNVDVNIYKIPK